MDERSGTDRRSSWSGSWTNGHTHTQRAILRWVAGIVAGLVVIGASASIGSFMGRLDSLEEEHRKRAARLDVLEEQSRKREEWQRGVDVKLDELLRRSHGHGEKGRVITGASQ